MSEFLKPEVKLLEILSIQQNFLKLINNRINKLENLDNFIMNTVIAF